jgi:hypothetical protein
MYGAMDKVICYIDIFGILSLCGTTVVTSTKKKCYATFFNFLDVPKTMMLIIQNLRIQLYIECH